MKRANVQDMMPLVKAFHLRTASMYSSMVKRYGPRYWQKGPNRGRLRIAGKTVPFALDEFRDWFLAQLGGRADGSGQCSYCKVPIDSSTLRCDHKTPVSRGGGLALDNLAPACDECNRLKSELTVDEFQNFRDAMEKMLRAGLLHPDGYKDIIKRMKGQMMHFQVSRQKNKAAKSARVDDPPSLGFDSQVEEKW